MFKKILLSGLLLIFLSGIGKAQDTSTLSGTVIDKKTEEPIPGATVFIVGEDRGTSTNFDGEYELQNLEFGNYTLRISFVGYSTRLIDYEVDQANEELDIELRQDLIGLDDVVVTAQQIERQTREIGTAVVSVKGDEFTKSRSDNFVNSLSAKVPGVDVSSQSGSVGGSSRIIIRGSASLTGDNQPLFIVDGIPISNANNSAGASANRLSDGAVDVGNRASDLNPDDIESISVLKGGSAAALYGQRARNGAIVITTKRGKDTPKATITVNSSVRTTDELVTPDYQNEFAQGDQGGFDATQLNGWGPKIEGQTVTDWKGEEVELQAFPDNVENFLDGGITHVNSVSIATGTSKNDIRLSGTRFSTEGLAPQSKLNRTNISINAGQEFARNIKARLSANYVFSESKNRTVQGGNDPNVLAGTVMGLPRNISNQDLRDNFRDPETGDQNTLTNFTNNPWWITTQNGFNNDVERFFGSLDLSWQTLDWLSFSMNAGTDFFTENRIQRSRPGTLGFETGAFSNDRIQSREIDVDFMASINKDLSEDFNIKGNIGHNTNVRRRERFSNSATNLTDPSLFTFANANSNTPTNNLTTQRLIGIYGDLTFGYQNELFLNVTGRNDWSSTLPKDNNSFFYPSASLSYIFTESLEIDSDILSYGKLRASISEVGSDENPFQLDFRFFPTSNQFGQFGTDITFPFNGLNAFGATGTIPPQDLQPEETITLEFGTELQFYDGRLGIDFTWYDEDTEDQIISIPVPEATGFTARRTNVGAVENQGIEVLLTAYPIRTNNFQWSSTFNFSKNEQTVEKLAEGVEELVIGTGFNGLQFKAVPGEEIGIFGNGWLRNDNGDILIDGTTGLKIPGPEIRLGDQNPDFTLGINNEVNYKNFDLSFLIDISKGGTIVSNTVSNVRGSGLAIETAELRNFIDENGEFIDTDGVVENPDGTFRENDVPVGSAQAFFANENQGSVFEEQAFSATSIKLREVRLSYSLPTKWIDGTPFGSLSVGFEGRNLWLIKSEVPHIDPETNTLGAASNAQGLEFNSLPGVRTLGVNVRFTL